MLVEVWRLARGTGYDLCCNLGERTFEKSIDSVLEYFHSHTEIRDAIVHIYRKNGKEIYRRRFLIDNGKLRTTIDLLN